MLSFAIEYCLITVLLSDNIYCRSLSIQTKAELSLEEILHPRVPGSSDLKLVDSSGKH